jgi:putative FmdB family regulatory protein
MPIYEYRCEKGHTFEVRQRFTDEPISECLTCSQPVEKVFHPVAVHFKGKGFYNTDYGTRKGSREAKESADSTSDSSKSDVKGDSGKSDASSSDSPGKSKAEAGGGSSSPAKSSSSSD